jgi:iron complex transport system ATP-binding protein
MRLAPENLSRTGAALLRSDDTGLTGSTVGIAGIDERDAHAMFAAFQVALSDDERGGDDFVAGKHRGGHRRLLSNCAGDIRITADFQTTADGGEGETKRNLIITKGHVAFTLSREANMTMQPEFLKMRNVDIARGEKVVLHEVNLTIATGEHIAILGPNGCGKSTLIKAMTCECYPIVRPGMELKVYGRDRWDVQELRKHLGVVATDLPGERTAVTRGLDAVVSGFFSSSTLWPNLEVTEAMRAGALDALKLLGAEHLRDRWVGEMSAGEKRRVMIARALVHRPGMLLLDEPSNALDLSAQRELREILRDVAGEMGLLMVTHHLADILPEMDRVVMMRNGRIFADGPKREMLQAARLEELFGVEVELTERNGYWHSW